MPGPEVLAERVVLADGRVDDPPVLVAAFDGDVHGRVDGHEVARMAVRIVEGFVFPEAQRAIVGQGIGCQLLAYPGRVSRQFLDPQRRLHLRHPDAAAADEGEVDVGIAGPGFGLVLAIFRRIRQWDM